MGMDLRVGQEFDVWAAKKGRINWIPMQVGMSQLYVSSDSVYLHFGVLFGGIKFPVAESQMEITGNPWPRRSVQMRSVAHTILLSRINSSGIRTVAIYPPQNLDAVWQSLVQAGVQATTPPPSP